MLNELRKIKEEITDILWPKTCLGCGKEGQYICKDCEIFLSEINPTFGYPISQKIYGWKSDITEIVSVWEYEGLMEKLIHKIKYDSCRDIIGELVEKALEKIDLNLPADARIAFVPMCKKKEKRRGFNQAELIAQKLGEKINRSIIKILEKIKDNQSQVDLNPQERLDNVKGAFSAVPLTKVRPPSIMLVDDVYTTGATMTECVKVLKKAGVKNIYGFTLARKLRI